MTPKKKAEELVLKFTWEREEHEKYVAKEIAKTCVEEMLSENNSIMEMLNIHGDDRTRLPVKFRIIWLKQVLEEIEKL